jgi:WD40 repeat protein
LQRNNLKDYVTIYTEGEPDSSATRIRSATSDLAGLAWAPDGKLLAVWDSPLSYTVAVYKRDGACVGRFQAYEGALGIRCVSWSPDSQLLAIGSYDQVRLACHIKGSKLV